MRGAQALATVSRSYFTNEAAPRLIGRVPGVDFTACQYG